MSSLKNMNLALAYIEENLTEAIDFRRVERVALCSEDHFRRVFSFLAARSGQTRRVAPTGGVSSHFSLKSGFIV